MDKTTNLHLIYIDDRGINPSFMKGIHEKIVLLATHYWKIGPNSWVVVADLDAKEWIEKLQLQPSSQITYASLYEGYSGNSLVIKLNTSDRFGFMPAEFWKWLDKVGSQPVLHLKVEQPSNKEKQ